MICNLTSFGIFCGPYFFLMLLSVPVAWRLDQRPMSYLLIASRYHGPSVYPQTASVSLTTSHRLPASTFMKKYVISKRGVAIVLQMLMKSTRVLTLPCNNPIDAIYFSKQINKSVAVASFLLSGTTRRTSRNRGSFRRALYSYTGDALYNGAVFNLSSNSFKRTARKEYRSFIRGRIRQCNWPSYRREYSH